MARYGIVCDVEKCDGCYSCFLSCKDEYVGNDHAPLSVAQSEKQAWMRLKEVEYGTGTKIKVDYIPIMCQHCENPSCMKAGPEGAVYKRDDGVVIIDPLKAKGAKEIVGACPYNAVFWNEQLQVPQKCTMCMHMIEAGEKAPRCVECCPTGALVFGDLDDPNSEISQLIAEKGDRLEKFHPEFGTEPAVSYLRLPKPFVAGDVYFLDTDECAIDVPVYLKDLTTGEVRESKTSYLGCLEFRDVVENREYEITIKAEGYKTHVETFRVKGGKNFGEIALVK